MSECQHAWSEPAQMKCMCGKHDVWMRCCKQCWHYQKKENEVWVNDEQMNKSVAEMRAKYGPSGSAG